MQLTEREYEKCPACQHNTTLKQAESFGCDRRTKLGSKNPRYVSACNVPTSTAMLHADMVGNYRHLTKKEIAAQYPPEKVEFLLAKANQNLKDIHEAKIIPVWADQ